MCVEGDSGFVRSGIEGMHGGRLGVCMEGDRWCL